MYSNISTANLQHGTEAQDAAQESQMAKSLDVKTGRIGHDYTLVYSGEAQYNGKTIFGASVEFLFQCYDRDGHEKLFAEGDDISSVLLVGFDRTAVCRVRANPTKMKRICNKYGLGSIRLCAHQYYLEYEDGHLSDELKTADEETAESILQTIQNAGDLPVSAMMEVDAATFKQFLLDHADGFDNSDNRRAQTCTVFFEDAEADQSGVTPRWVNLTPNSCFGLF